MKLNQSNSEAVAPPVAKAQWVQKFLGDGEEIILITKPSVWSILVQALPGLFVLAMIICYAAYMHSSSSRMSYDLSSFLICGSIIGVVAQFFYSSASWVSKYYVLTNRRVLIIRGPLSTEVIDCELKRISEVQTAALGLEKIFGLATIKIDVIDNPYFEIDWDNLKNADDIAAEIRLAILKRPRE